MTRTENGSPEHPPKRPQQPERQPYERPRIVDRGRLVEIALGGSPGSGDSGAGALIEDPLG